MNSHVVYKLSLLHILLLVYMLGGGGYASRSSHVYPLKVGNNCISKAGNNCISNFN